MSLPVEVLDGLGKGYKAGVTRRNQLVTSPLEYNEPYFKSMTTINTAFNFVKPMAERRFVIDGIIFTASKEVSNSDGAKIDIYEANSSTSTTILKSILTLDIARLAGNIATGLNIIVTQGVWVNGKTNDDITNVTILGYFIDA